MIVFILKSFYFNRLYSYLSETMVFVIWETGRVSNINIIFANSNGMSLLDRVVIVTGSSKGIGFEIAKEFSERGYSHSLFS